MHPPSSRSLPIIAGVCALLFALAAAIALTAMRRGVPASPPPDALNNAAAHEAFFASMRIPEFTMRDHADVEQTRDIFKDRWTILAFTFTNCPMVCPIMHSHLIRAQELLRGSPVRIVAISVDPIHDTPDALARHASKIGAETGLWTFLSSDAETLERVLAGLKLGISQDATQPITIEGGGVMNNIEHPSRLLLIGPDVSVRAMESGLEWSSVEKLARQAMRRAGQ